MNHRLALGLGCDRGTPAATLERAVTEALALLGADADDVAADARLAADAWWALLDERQAEAVAA